MFGEIAPKFRSFLTNFLTLTGVSGEAPAVFRQTGGTPGVKELQVYHDGTQTVVKCLTGPVRIQAPNTGSTDYLDVYDNGGNAFVQVTANTFLVRSGIASLLDNGSTWNITNTGRFITASTYDLRVSAGGSIDAGLARAAAGIVQVTNGSTGYGSLQAGVSDAGTTTTPVGLQVGHNTSGTPAAGFGTAVLLVGQSSTTADQPMARLVASWATATDASRKGRAALLACDSTGTDHEGFRVESDGTQALLGFYGVAAVARPSGDVATALAALGLMTAPTYASGAGVGKHVFTLPEGSAAVGTDQSLTYGIVPVACTAAKVWVSAKIAPTGAALILDILKSSNNGSTWTSLWATTPANRPTLAAGSNNGSTTSFDTTALAAGDWLRIDVAQVGSTVAGSGVVAVLATT